MKKIFSLVLALVMCLSLCACGGEGGASETTAASEETVQTVMTKDEMLINATALTRDEIDKSISNIAFAKGLIGNTYTFAGEVQSVKEDHAVVTFYISDENGNYVTNAFVMVANLYLPLDELASLEYQHRLSFVGTLDDVASHEESIPDWGTENVVDMIFKNVAIVTDRFEETGKLHSQNTSYGENAWNIKFPDNDFLSVVHFRDDVSSYQGQEITYSYKVTSEGRIDAYIVE